MCLKLCYIVSMNWSRQRRTWFIGGLFLFVLLFVVLPLYVKFYQAPTCFDARQNGGEAGVDCGGSCELLCRADEPLNVEWSRYAKVTKGAYNVLAYIENPNPEAGIKQVGYMFRLFDRDNTIVAERSGVTSIPAKRLSVIFEPSLTTGEREVTHMDFRFTTDLVWTRSIGQESSVSVNEITYQETDIGARVEAVVSNTSLSTIDDIELVVILYDDRENAVGFSRTLVDSLAKQASQSIVYTWPTNFPTRPARIEILPRVK